MGQIWPTVYFYVALCGSLVNDSAFPLLTAGPPFGPSRLPSVVSMVDVGLGASFRVPRGRRPPLRTCWIISPAERGAPSPPPTPTPPAPSRAGRELIGSSLACRDSDHANALMLTNRWAHQNITSAITRSSGQLNEHMLPHTHPSPPPLLLQFLNSYLCV